MSDARLEARDLGKTYHASAGGEVAALDGVDLRVEPGELVAVLGPSGCGKSTLLALLGGFEAPTRGGVMLDGGPVVEPSPRVVTVFQDYALFPWLNVLGNVEYGLRAHGLPRKRRRERAMREIATVGLAGFASSRPAELSGGMRQRVSLARALAVDPEVVLMDEPFGALDAVTRMRMQEELARVWRAEGATIVLVTHDVDEAVYLADRVVLLTPAPGRVQEVVPVALPRPRERDSEGFFRLRAHILRALHLAEERTPPEYEI
ncbi:MAG: ABC transporter ATP-binding protein [Coriobacteriia bacterium]|nr:ABC transporter ATP-binding protein [Coriobacteriia bacterium]